MIKILIIEDDPLMRKMYQNVFMLSNLYEVEVAIDGEEGIAKAKTTKPQIILLDIMMPKMNGLEVLDSIKSDPGTKQIPVIILSNLSGEQDEETALSKGAAKYLIKSNYEPKQILDLVNQMVNK